MTDTRLIERWLPIAALGEESVRERRSMTALPAIYYLHIWWARRPLVASRAAVLAALLPADVDRDRFMHALGIHGDPVAARRKMDAARRTGIRIENPYDWDRAYTHSPDEQDRAWITSNLVSPQPSVLDPTAGGGSIPFEATRLGLTTFANDLNPVAALIMRATIEWPMKLGSTLKPAFDKIAREFSSRLNNRLERYFPQPLAPDCLNTTYLWARTVRCPYCDGLVPLSPNWRLAPDGTGVHLAPILGAGPGDPTRKCDFVIVGSASGQSAATVTDGDGLCPFPDCGRVIEGAAIKQQAQTGGLGEQLYAVAFKRRVRTVTKAGKSGRDKWARGYRAPTDEDRSDAAVSGDLAEKLDEWLSLDIIPSESIGDLSNYDRGHKMYGMRLWRDLFNPRQLLGHGLSVE